jgi:hypothetical protein
MPAIVGRKYMKGGFKSFALDCHPSQAKKFQERVDRNGCTGIKYEPSGRCHVSSEADYARVCESLKLHEQPLCYPPPDD